IAAELVAASGAVRRSAQPRHTSIAPSTNSAAMTENSSPLPAQMLFTGSSMSAAARHATGAATMTQRGLGRARKERPAYHTHVQPIAEATVDAGLVMNCHDVLSPSSSSAVAPAHTSD